MVVDDADFTFQISVLWFWDWSADMVNCIVSAHHALLILDSQGITTWTVWPPNSSPKSSDNSDLSSIVKIKL